MASYFLSPIGNDTPFYKAGVQASGCKIFTYLAGSTTKAVTFTDSTGNTSNANPILLNSEGYPASGGNVVGIWLTQGVSYKFVMAPSTDTDPPSSPIWTRDNIVGIDDVTLTQSEWVSGPAPTFVSSTQFTLVGDQTSNFHVGRRVKYTVTAGTGYATITASAFSTVTTVTVDSQGSNALDSGLSAVSYSLLRADNFTQSLGLDSITRYATAIAAAAALNLNAVGGDHVHISSATATTTITSGTLAQGHQRTVTFDSPQILTSNSGFILPTGTLGVHLGESITLKGEPSNVTRMIGFSRIPVSVLLIEKTASSSASLAFTTADFSWSEFDKYLFEFIGLLPGTTTMWLRFQLSEDNGGTYKSGANDYLTLIKYEDAAITNAAYYENGLGAGQLFGSSSDGNTAQGNGADDVLYGELVLWKPSTAIRHRIPFRDISYRNANVSTFVAHSSGQSTFALDTNALSGIKFFYSTGNIASGTIRVYGMRKS